MPVFFVTPYRRSHYFSPITISGQIGGIVRKLHNSCKVQKKKTILIFYIEYDWICTFSNITTFLEPQKIFGCPTLKKGKHVLLAAT